MPVYRIDVKIWGTAYIRAPDAEEAKAKAIDQLNDSVLELSDRTSEYGDVWVSGKQYDDPDLPSVSLSPVFTIAGPEPDTEPELAG